MTHLTRKYVCGVCSKAYTKAEHLQRHRRSHTGDKPFICGQCQQKFTRLDSLIRHQRSQNHNDSMVSPGIEQISTSDADFSNSTIVVDNTEAIVDTTFEADISQMTETTNTADPIVLRTDNLDQDNSLLTDYTTSNLMPLTWPDSEAFLQSILNINVSSWPQSYETLPSQYFLQPSNQSLNESQSPWLANNTTESSSGGTNAVRSVSQIISTLSSDLASEAESAALSTMFLEACLHAFFEQMTLVLPICHRQTFVFADWTHPLLLNAIALGSLFIGQDINIAKGEVLWTLAHTAVATSWHSLIGHRAPYDSSNGVQIVMIALLGQTFAMLSGSPKLRSTAQIFHSLGFYWARQCGTYSSSVSSSLIQAAVTSTEEEEKLTLWRKWAAEEVKLRALLGHYILDGQLTYFTGAPTCQRHTSNLLPFPSSDKLFASSTLQEWLDVLQTEHPVGITFQEFFVQSFRDPTLALLRGQGISFLAVQVILEGLQSLVTDSNIVGDQAVGSPSAEAIDKVLYSFPKNIMKIEHLTTGERLQLLLRWHMMCVDRAIHVNHLCRDLCDYLSIQQNIFARVDTTSPTIDFSNWTRTRSARIALLHAAEIRNILSDLPIWTIHAIHIPCTLFAAAIVHMTFVVGGVTMVSLPKVCNWSMLIDHDADNDTEAGDIWKYLSSSVVVSNSSARNLLYDMNNFLLLTKQLRRPWAICRDLGTILHHMYARYGT